MIRLQTRSHPPRRTTLFIVLTLLTVLAALLLVIHPLLRKQRRLTREWENAQQIVDAFTREKSGLPPERQLAIEQQRFQKLQRKWDLHLPRIQQFRNQTLSRVVTRSYEGRIDFKIALIEARQRLGQLSSEHQTALPPDLGIPDTIGADEQAETRLGQLAATLLLLETCMRLDIPVVHQVRALPPHHIPLGADPWPALSFYPVFLHLHADFEQWTALNTSLLESDTFFVLHHLQVESGFPDNPDLMKIQATWSAVGMSSGEPPELLESEEDRLMGDPEYDPSPPPEFSP